MLKDLIVNFVILSVFLFLVSPWIIRESQQAVRSIAYRLGVGGLFGALGTILLFFSINVDGHTPLNMRGIALMLAAYFGGPIGALAELAVVYVARLIKEGSIDAVQMAIGATATIGTGLLFAWFRRFAVKWAFGGLFLLIYYYLGLWFADQISMSLARNYMLYQAGYATLTAAFLYYLIQNDRNKRLIEQSEQDKIFMLRMQPGYTMRFQKRNGKFYYTLIEGQLLNRAGYDPSSFIGKSVDELQQFTPEYKSWVQERYERAWNGEMVTYENKYTGVDVLVTLHPIVQDGVVTDVVGTGVDITEVKKREVADESNKAKSRFLAQMSHEIRTPINAIIGLNYILQQTDLNERQKDYVGKSITAAKSLLTIVNDVLDFSKIEAGKVVLEHIEFDLYEVLQNISNLVSFKAYEKGLKFHFAIHHEVPQMLVGDPFRLQQILLNVMNNAVKFTPKGELSISVSMEQAERSKPNIVFSIRDTGIGMTEQQLNQLFREFSQADMSTTRKYGGTGLGLVISQKFVQLMGGAIEVESAIGQGSTFSIKLPFSAAGAYLSPNDGAGIQAVRVLLVCADQEMQWVLRRQLGQLKCIVNVAGNAYEAMEKLDRAGTYALVLLDWKLQGDDPAAFADKIRNRETYGNPTVIIVSAYHETEVQAAAQAPSVAKTLLYPISQSQLYNEIVEVVALQPLIKPPSEGNAQRSQPYCALKDAVVLLVEDNEINQVVARELLKEVVSRVDVAIDGQEAVSLVGAVRYDAILMDLQMPNMDGYEATRAIRQLAYGQEVPIIAMTADAEKGVEDQVLAVGMNDYLSKPFDPIDLYNMLQRNISNSAKKELIAASRSAAAGDEAYAIVDRAGALMRLGGNAQLYERILELFVSEHGDDIARIKESLAAEDWNRAAIQAHALKGAAANIGANELASLMAEVQESLQNGRTAALGDRLSQAEQRIQAILRAAAETIK